MPRRRKVTYVRAMTRRSKRRFRTAAEWRRIIQDWEASGLGAKRFAEGRGFSAASLYLWRKRLRAGESPPVRGPMDFVPVVVEDEVRAGLGGGTRWELETASGLALTMSGPDAVRGLEIALRFVADEALD